MKLAQQIYIALNPLEEGASPDLWSCTGRTKAKGKAKITTQRFRCPNRSLKDVLLLIPILVINPLNIKQSNKIKGTREQKVVYKVKDHPY